MELSMFAEFGIVIGLAAGLAIISTKLKQPAILGYILAGLLISLNPYFHVGHEELELFSKVGITLLLFVLGLELNVHELKHLGKVAVVSSLGQILLSFVAGFGIAHLLGFSSIASIYIGLGITFSSTVIVVKLLSQKKQMETLHGRIAIGILLVQDLVAIMLLIGLSALGRLEGGSGAVDVAGQLAITLVKGAVAAGLVVLFVQYALNPLLNWVRAEKEVLFMTVIAWALLLAAVMGSEVVGFSLEVGGLMAGIALSSRFEHLQIESWTKPLRDFFLMLFFVLLGLEVNVDSVQQVLPAALILSVFVVITKPVIVLLIMRMLGYTSKVSFLTAVSIAQISEFSLIVAKFAFDMGQVDSSILTLLTIAGGVSMMISSYIIFYNERVFELVEPLLSILRFSKVDKHSHSDDDFEPEIILFGCHRMGRNLLNLIPLHKEKVLVIDFDPKAVSLLRDNGYHAMYGDISDIELYDAYKLKNARIIISTVPSIKENKKLLQHLKKLDPKPISLIMANDDQAAKELYHTGVDFVIYPHLLGGELVSDIISTGRLTRNMVQVRSRQMQTLHVDE